MSNEKQTAVQFMLKEFSAIIGELKTTVMQNLLLKDAYDKALQMEREQIEKAYLSGNEDTVSEFEEDREMSPSDYYDKTYGGGK